MKLNGIVESLEHKSIFVTGSTGYLGKIFVEKILRVQPNVKQLFLLVRAPNVALATRRLHNEVITTDLFKVLRTKYGVGYEQFIFEKITVVVGDITLENLGLDDSDLRTKMWQEVDIVANFAAVIAYMGRYDLELGVNALGAKHVLDFAKKCLRLEMLLHVSTAYVWGNRAGLVLENPLQMGSEGTSTDSSPLDILQVEMKLVKKRLDQLKAAFLSTQQQTDDMKRIGVQRAKLFGWPYTYLFTKAMGEMVMGQLRGNIPLVIIRPTAITSTYSDPFPGWVEGLRTTDNYIVGCGQGKLMCYVGNPYVVFDMIPADMVVNATIVAMVNHANEFSKQFIYQLCTSTNKDTMNCIRLIDYAYKYFSDNPWKGKDGKYVQISEKPRPFPSQTTLTNHLHLNYTMPLKEMKSMNGEISKYISGTCNDIERKIGYVLRMAELLGPYALCQTIFDNTKTENLRKLLTSEEAETFNFDTKQIDWEEYLMNIHIPGLVKYVIKNIDRPNNDKNVIVENGLSKL